MVNPVLCVFQPAFPIFKVYLTRINIISHVILRLPLY